MLVAKQGGALRIAALDAAATALGLSLGMPLAEARARSSLLRSVESEPHADAAFLRRCADVCERFTPLTALWGSDGLMLDVTGCTHLFGGEQALMAEARRWMGACGLTVAAALASTPDAAAAFARHAPGLIAPHAEAEALARRLPLVALDCDDAVIVALRRAGFSHLGDLADRPTRILASRFGEAVTERLGRILGRIDRRITPLRPPPELLADKLFAEPVTAMEALLAALESLATALAEMLEQRSLGGRGFRATLFRTDGAVVHLDIETAQPLREVRALMRLFRLRIDTLAEPVDFGFGFDALRLAVLRTDRLEHRQQTLTGSLERPADERALADLIDRLIARFGHDNVRRFVARDSHDPVRASGTAPYADVIPDEAGTHEDVWPPLEAGQPPMRPLTLFAQPQPIEALAEVPDGPPLRFRWRRVLHDVARAEGPERIAPEWWLTDHQGAQSRDYYRVEDAAGRRFWVFREGSFEDVSHRSRWYLHGLFA
ncbi:Y-family DNA polymerase [Methyloraptor flagellatus]|uniref:DNA polymerase Y family protein n=1 Tax=Methyloraptor flagellatus TaxID=3162530 RepID=A0AAU7XFY1_9HYPH